MLRFTIVSDPPKTKSTVRVVAPVSEAPVNYGDSLVVIRGGELGRRYPLGSRWLTIGRSRNRDIYIEEDLVSRRHCKVKRDGSVVLVQDTSSNGTYVNDDRIHGEQRALCDGDLIRVGPWILKFLDRCNIENSYHEAIHRLATRDGLTDIFNRRYFGKTLARTMERTHGDLALIMVDVDRFKRINDEHGHIVGDLVLQHMAKVLQESLLEKDILARYGGEEFAIILSRLDERNALEIGKDLRKRVEGATFRVNSIDIPVTISVGVATFTDEFRDTKDLIASADSALRRAKRSGRNTVREYEPGRDGPFAEHQNSGRDRSTSDQVEPIPIHLLRGQLIEEAKAGAETTLVTVGACVIHHRLALRKEVGRAAVEAYERWLLQVLQRHAARLQIAEENETYLYLIEVADTSESEAVAASINQEFQTKVARSDLPIRTELLRLCHGFASAKSPIIDIDKLISSAQNEVERDARQTSSDTKWPYPVAHSLEMISAVEKPEARINRIFQATETSLRFLTSVAFAAVWRNEERREENADAVQRLVQLAEVDSWDDTSIRNFRAFLEVASEKSWPLMTCIAQSILDQADESVDLLSIASEVFTLCRNHHHANEEPEQRNQEKQIERCFEQFKRGIKSLSRYHLYSIDGCEFVDDETFWCTLRDHTGPDQLFSVARIKRKRPLQNGTYLFTEKLDSHLQLSPLIIMADCPICQHAELFWTPDFEVRSSETRYEGIITRHKLSRTVCVQNIPQVFTANAGSDTLMGSTNTD